jgi:hypothetical protein
MKNGDAMAMMSPDRKAAKVVKRADPTKAIVPLVAALVPAAAVPAVGVVAIAGELNCLRERQTSKRGQSAAAAVADARPGPVRNGERRQSQRQICKNARSPVRHDSLTTEENHRPPTVLGKSMRHDCRFSWTPLSNGWRELTKR